MTVESVTRKGRNAGAQLVPGRISASSHVLVKVVGQTISASWSVTNTGGTSAQGALDISFPGVAGLIFGPVMTIPAGGTMTLTVSGPTPNLAPGTYSGNVLVSAVSPATVALGGIHPFTLTVSASVAALSAVGSASFDKTTVRIGSTLTGFWAVRNDGGNSALVDFYMRMQFLNGSSFILAQQPYTIPVGSKIALSVTWIEDFLDPSAHGVPDPNTYKFLLEITERSTRLLVAESPLFAILFAR